MSQSLLEKPPRPLPEVLEALDTQPRTNIGDFTLRAYYGGLYDDIDPQDARAAFALAAAAEQL